jgi:hypothetical protein
MGQIAVLLIGGIALVALAVLFLFRPPTRPKGKIAKSATISAPAADEPTPDRSVTSSPSQIAAAKRHTPPA